MRDMAYSEKVWDFLETGKDELHKLELAIESGDTLTVRSYTRDLISKAGTLDLGDVVRYAKALQKGARRGCLTYSMDSYQNLLTSIHGLEENLANVSEQT
ncbi:MAG: hypothetical protein HN368_01125 [Spirochaetales bacterium]|jgi:hypothetical protein|nr:hypothetical protein [Spirochaetales bacterium]